MKYYANCYGEVFVDGKTSYVMATTRDSDWFFYYGENKCKLARYNFDMIASSIWTEITKSEADTLLNAYGEHMFTALEKAWPIPKNPPKQKRFAIILLAQNNMDKF